MSETRVLPLPKVTGLYEHDYSKYPERIRVPMSDGRVITYNIENDLPHPSFIAAMNNIERMEVCGRT